MAFVTVLTHSVFTLSLLGGSPLDLLLGDPVVGFGFAHHRGPGREVKTCCAAAARVRQVPQLFRRARDDPETGCGGARATRGRNVVLIFLYFE